LAASKKEPLFTIKTTQKLLKTSGDQAQELIESQVMGQAVLEGHLMVPAQDQLQAPQMEMVVTAQDQRELQAMALEQMVVIPAMVLLMAPEAQATALVMVPQVALMALAVVPPAEMVVVMVAVAVAVMVAPQVQAMAPEMEAMAEVALTVA